MLVGAGVKGAARLEEGGILDLEDIFTMAERIQASNTHGGGEELGYLSEREDVQLVETLDRYSYAATCMCIVGHRWHRKDISGKCKRNISISPSSFTNAISPYHICITR